MNREERRAIQFGRAFSSRRELYQPQWFEEVLVSVEKDVSAGWIEERNNIDSGELLLDADYTEAMEYLYWFNAH